MGAPALFLTQAESASQAIGQLRVDLVTGHFDAARFPVARQELCDEGRCQRSNASAGIENSNRVGGRSHHRRHETGHGQRREKLAKVSARFGVERSVRTKAQQVNGIEQRPLAGALAPRRRAEPMPGLESSSCHRRYLPETKEV
jgi:hypothetical protein